METDGKKSVSFFLENSKQKKNDYICRIYHVGIVPTTTKFKPASHEKLPMQEMWHID
jgi:hypothetical protein